MWLSQYLNDVAAQVSLTARAMAPLTEDATYNVAPELHLKALPFEQVHVLRDWTQMGRGVGDLRYYQCKQILRAELRAFLADESQEPAKAEREEGVREAFLSLLKIDTEFHHHETVDMKKTRVLEILEGNSTPSTTFYSSFGLGKVMIGVAEQAGFLIENKGYEPVKIPGHLRHK